MSVLTDKLQADLKQAMKDKNDVKKNVITLIRAALKNESINLGRELNEKEEIAVVQRELKQTKDAIADYVQFGRQEMVDKEQAKIEVINEYLPRQWDKNDILELLATMNIEKGAKSGPIIGMVRKQSEGNADGNLTKEVVEGYLATL